MATSLLESIIRWRKKLETATDDATIINIIHKLSKVPITTEILQETHIGKCIRQIAKRHDSVGKKALAVLKKWRQDFAREVEKARTGVSSSNSVSKKENVNKESSSYKSSSKQDVKDKKSDHKKKLQSEHKHKQKKENSTSHSSQQSSKYTNGDLCNTANTSEVSYNVEESSPSLYTYEKSKADTKYKDYDPHADSNEGYNPECPELYPGSTSLKGKKADSFIDTYKPSSVKHKSDSREQTVSNNKAKKLKTESAASECKLETKQSSEKKEKHSFHKDKSRDNKASSSHTTKKESGDKRSDKPSKQKSSDSKKPKSKHSTEKNSVSMKSKTTIKINCTEEFTSSEVRFEDCLGFNDIVTVKKKKSTKPVSTPSSKKPFSNSNKTSASSSSSKPGVQHKVSSSTESKVSKEKSSREILHLKVPKPSSKLVEVDVVSTLPEILPNYRPLPQRSLDSSSSKRKVLTDEEAIRFISSRREKTAVYSGRKSYFTEVPSLFECCTRVLIDNIDAIEYVGGEVPYLILKPVLERCTPTQLYNIENYNPYLLDDTHELWEVHCKRDYKLLSPEECETWRELYVRAHEEREKKLKNVTANISASMSKSNPVRQVKLAYVDSVAKPPRDVARRQAKHGTALPVSHPIKVGPPAKATPRPTAPATNSAAASSSTPSTSITKMKPKVAPLMAKTLKSMKMCFRR